jgi:hypothetical protein
LWAQLFSAVRTVLVTLFLPSLDASLAVDIIAMATGLRFVNKLDADATLKILRTLSCLLPNCRAHQDAYLISLNFERFLILLKELIL